MMAGGNGARTEKILQVVQKNTRISIDAVGAFVLFCFVFRTGYCIYWWRHGAYATLNPIGPLQCKTLPNYVPNFPSPLTETCSVGYFFSFYQMNMSGYD